MKLFPLITCLLISGSVAVDFTTIGQKEIVDYIKNRADLLHGTKLSERNLQDLLSSAVFTGLEEEALIFAYGSSVNSDLDAGQLSAQLSVLTASVASSDSVPLKIFLTSNMFGTTNIALDRLTTKSSSSKSSVGDFVVNCFKQNSFDSTSLDGSITINLEGATDSHNLTLTKTIYLAAEVNVTSLGSNWESSSSLLISEGKLLSMLNSREGSMFIITYQSLIRETIQANEGNLFGGLKSSGKVLVVVNSDGEVSLSGRTISGKIEATRNNEVEELVDRFLTLNGSKSRRFMINDITKTKSKNLVAKHPWTSKDIELVKNWLYSQIGKKATSNTIRFDHYGSGSSKEGNRKGNSRSGHGTRRGGSKDSNRKRGDRGSWKTPCNDAPTWPSWKSFYDFDFGYGWEAWDPWNGFFGDSFEDWIPCRHGRKPVTTTPKPEKTTKKPKETPSSTPKPIGTIEPVATSKVEPEIEVTTVKMTTEPEYKETTRPIVEPEEKPDLSEPDFTGLPKGTTVSFWTTRII